MFLLFCISVIYTGTIIFRFIFRIQQRIFEGPMYWGGFPLSAAHQEFQGLMVMAWKTLRRHMVPIDNPLDTLWMKKTTLYPKSLRKYLNSKASMVSGIPLERMSKELVKVKCLRSKSVDFDLYPLKPRDDEQ